MVAVGKVELEDGIEECTAIDTFGSVEEGMEEKSFCGIGSECGVTIGAEDWERRTSMVFEFRGADDGGVVRGLYGPNREG